MDGAMRRLYVGGLSHTITQKDLKDRFGKFGDVEDVELRTRSDDEGVPYKTFSYININISDGDLKKCMTVLNKSKWKGGTLQIETARESFLHRLAEERETAAEPRPAAEDKKQKMLDSLSKAGVDNFTMKAAVPGTEVPGHKDWVVSKFGRVLPVLQIRCQKGSRARTMTYDPSKYSHNIRRLDRSADEPPPTPVTQLTWELRGGDDDISKKRRGEFSPFEPARSKKRRPEAVSAQSAGGGARFKRTVVSVGHGEEHLFANGNGPPPNPRLAQGSGPRFTDWDLEPEEEILKTAAAQSSSHDALRPEEEKEEEEDTLEVVGLDYLVKSGRKGGPDDEDENDYDSADTDELFASRKPPLPPHPPLPPAQERPTPPAAAGNDGDRKRKMKKKSHTGEEEDESSDAEEEVASRKPSGKQSTWNQSKKMKVLPVVNLPSSDEEEEEEELAECSSDSDYEAMFSNVTRLEISLADLQKLAEESQQTSEPEVNLTAKKGTTPEEILAALLEDSSEDEQQKKKKKKTKGSTPMPAFQGTRALSEGSETEERRQKGGEEEEEEEEEGGGEVEKQKLDPKATGCKINGRKATESESSDEEEEEEEEAGKVVKNMAETASSSSSDEEEEEEEEAGKVVKNMAETASSSSDEEEERVSANPTVLTPKAAAASPSSSSSSAEEDEQESESSSSEEEEEEEVQAPARVPLGAEEEEERQRKANARRLAAVQQRQKEAEEHKKLIQGALANLDAPKAGAGKRIVFGSDDEEEDEEDKQQTTSALTKLQNGQSDDEDDEDEGDEDQPEKEKVRRKRPVPQLFGGSEDEDEEDADEEEDGSRFDIRPQFEGRGGQKLMELQSRFGTDERFRMDSRFLEEDEDKGEESENKKSVTEEEEALEEERRKNMSILQSVLGGQQTCGGKTPAKAKTFRDVSALHYDPSNEEHAAFETKSKETRKESKAARRKKREEAQKLPEVSKEIYYDVSGDLKAVFGSTKEDEVAAAAAAGGGGGGETNWDEEEEDEEGKDEQPTLQSTLLSADPEPENEEPAGFKFSFFEDAAETGSAETAEYKVESIQAPKVSWQQDLRFQDSSSDEEEEEKEVEEEEEQSSAGATGTTEPETPSKTHRFFFFLGDSRLAEGPGSFCRPAQLEEQREQWEEQRSELREEYRKKHKDARRKLRSSLKS